MGCLAGVAGRAAAAAAAGAARPGRGGACRRTAQVRLPPEALSHQTEARPLPLHVGLLPCQLRVALVQLVHEQVHLRRAHVAGQHVVRAGD